MTTLPPQNIGPFVIERLLGQGGMGCVYLARDERLQRYVALKTLPQQNNDIDNELMREARAAAALNHPHITQIYDIQQQPDQTLLVLEWVDGVTLAQFCAHRPLPALQVYNYAQQIISGLSAAHRAGIVHKDLKSENVMVTSDGRIKILDFGLATAPHAINNGPLTGTCRCMSPEQIAGGKVDGRCDLFALGVLLYELLTAASPFLRDTAEATLNAVRQEEADDPRRHNVDIPVSFSALIMRLLAKNPEQRPANADILALELERIRPQLLHDQISYTGQQNARQNTLMLASGHQLGVTTQSPAPHTAITNRPSHYAPNTGRSRWTGNAYRWLLLAAILISGALWIGSRWLQPESPRYIAIATPQISGINAVELEATLQAALSMAISKELESRPGLIIVPADVAAPAADDPGALGRATAADEVVVTHLDCTGAQCQAAVNRQNTADNRSLWSRSFSAPPDPQILFSALRIHLNEGYSDYRPRHEYEKPISASDWDQLIWLQAEFERNEEQHLDIDETLRRLSQIQQRSPDLHEAALLRARLLLYRYQQQATVEDLQQAQAAISELDESAGAASVAFSIALARNDLNAAERALEKYSALQPGSASILAMRSRMASRRGEEDTALVLMHEAAHRQPSWRHWFWAAQIAHRQGEIEMARVDLEHLLSLIPEHYAGLSILAEIELQDGQLNAAEAIYRRLVLRSPQLTELSNLGVAYLFLGQYEEAAHYLNQALAMAPENPYVALNLADALALAGKQEQATNHYLNIMQSIERTSSHWPELATLAQALAHLNHKQQALSVVHKMLELAEEHPQALYSAALVHAILDDQTNAAVYYHQARKKGVANVWFQLPWFDAFKKPAVADATNHG